MADRANNGGYAVAAASTTTSAEAENLRLYRALHPTYRGRHLMADPQESVTSLSSSSSGSITPDLSDRDGSANEASDTSVETLNFAQRDFKDITTVSVEKVAHEVKAAREIVVTKLFHPSAKKAKRRPRFKDVKFQPHTTILEAEASRTSVFAGFYTLFWLGTFILFTKTVLVNYRNTGYFLDTHIVSILWRDLPKIAISDLVLFLLTFANVVLQQAIVKNKISWNSTGWAIQSCYEVAFIGLALWWPMYNDYPWIGRVFLCLHSLVLLMKQHSYAFFCGYLSVVKRDLALFESALAGLRSEEGDGTPSPIQDEQEEHLHEEIAMCQTELRSSLPMSKVMYPNNVTFFNFFDYMMLPTLVYELEYPRTESIRWDYVFEKIAAIFGVFFLMIIIAEQYFYPIVMHALSLRSLPFLEKVTEYPFLLFELLFPFLLMYLLTWYIIWDAILNEIAELTHFADRYFYGDWWNSVQWDQFAREWNVPVHQFLLRHVYHSSISAFQVSKGAATVITFLLSSVIHELVMFVIFKKLRGYLLVLQMCQLPLVQLSKTNFLRNNKILGNIMFWFGIYTGPSMMCMLYLTF
ncbi:MBOAT, membrane-bound O-acyltransferase family-domain-containing protein [Lipomyces orientalis]|uniref:MBOAT, membrane-bound O-acyltransferase family-domain-containing protein n=1 Tax=Lipomyces orientalis TaxID=1233043 RepID=A0ACC3TMR8_9ASCO